MALNLTRKDPEDIKGYEVDDTKLQDLGDTLKALVAAGFNYGELAWRRLPECTVQFTVTASPPVGDPVVAHDGQVLVGANGDTVTAVDAETLQAQYDAEDQ
ncbi:MAG: hypothetical protein QOD58_3070 [Mycobacterium sp.]|nr:hypothetical protein [Mycobacterium sp.]